MTRYLLDTNVISNVVKPRPSPTLIDWLSRQRDEDLFIAAHTLAETWRGILTAPHGKKRDDLVAWFHGPEGPPAWFSSRILPYDTAGAIRWAEIIAEARTQGRTLSPTDMIIAATALEHGCIVVTDNERDFAGVVEIINPVRNAIP